MGVFCWCITSVLIAVACTVSATPYFIHISDPHIDSNYKVNASVDCSFHSFGIPCCHDLDPSLPPEKRAPMFGHQNCETPIQTFTGMVQVVAKQYPKPELVLMTGDMASHDIFYEDPDTIAQKWDFVFKTVKQYFGQNVKIICTIGNFDAYPFDQMADNQTDEVITKLADVMYSHGVIHKDIEYEDVFSQHGFYKTSIPNSNVDAIVVNTILSHPKNGETDPNNPDPAGMYSWMQKRLAESAAAKRKVWIVGHVPPLHGSVLQREVDMFRSLIIRFVDSGTVTASFFGHSHNDEFFLSGMRNLKDNARFVGYIAPGLTTSNYCVPAIRVVDVESSDLTIVDWRQYRIDLPKSNSAGKVILNHLYDFRDYYDVPDMSPKSFQYISKSILTNVTIANRYINARFGWDMGGCGEACRKMYFCLTSFRETAELNKSCYESSYSELVESLDN